MPNLGKLDPAGAGYPTYSNDAEKVVSLIAAEESKGLGNSLDLQLTCFGALLVFLVHVLAALLQIGEEGCVCSKCLTSVLKAFLGLGILFICGAKLHSLSVDEVLSSLDLSLLRSLEVLVILLALHLLLLGICQISFEALFHLFENTKNFSRGWRLFAGCGLDERANSTLLRWSEHIGMFVHQLLEH